MGVLFCLLLGWWGFPWGLILTPVQVVRNVSGMLSGRESSRPSEDLRRVILVNLGMQALQQQRTTAQRGAPTVA